MHSFFTFHHRKFKVSKSSNINNNKQSSTSNGGINNKGRTNFDKKT